MKRVVITGIGAVTPLGNDMNETWDNLTLQRSGIGLITKFDSSGLSSRLAGELKSFTVSDYLPEKDILRLDPFIHYAAAGALMAAEDSGLPFHALKGERTGVVIGSSRGGISTMERAVAKHVSDNKPFSAYLMSSSTINMASAYISMRLGTRGPAVGVSTACASGTTAIGESFRMIQRGDIDIALSGGSEAPVCRLAVGGYGASGALSRRNDEPHKASRPFDRDRDGFVVAEGACVLLLEELSHALKRNAIIYAELAGYGTSSDAFHQTKPNSEGEASAIGRALKDADVSTDGIDYINAHATSTPLGDETEAAAIKQVFGSRTGDVYVSSCKSMMGHMLGAAGAVEAAVTALSIKRNIITPTVNFENPGPGCDLQVPTSMKVGDVGAAISNSFGFGGVNAVLVLKKFNPDYLHSQAGNP